MDKRIVRSRVLINQALLDILKVKNFPDITVSEIAKRANIDRKTFYAHYNSTNDVMKVLEDKLSIEMTKIFVQPGTFSISVFIDGMTELMFAQFDVYLHIANSKNYSVILTDIKRILTNVLIKQFERNPKYTQEEFNIAMKFIASGVIDHFQTWLQTSEHSNDVLDESNKMIKEIVNHELAIYRK